jgi:hypothetical protein
MHVDSAHEVPMYSIRDLQEPPLCLLWSLGNPRHLVRAPTEIIPSFVPALSMMGPISSSMISLQSPLSATTGLLRLHHLCDSHTPPSQCQIGSLRTILPIGKVAVMMAIMLIVGKMLVDQVQQLMLHQTVDPHQLLKLRFPPVSSL